MPLHVINVGEGDGLGLTSKHKRSAVLVDFGSKKPSTRLPNASAYLRGLTPQGRLPLFILSHYHHDHYNGLTSGASWGLSAEGFPVSEVWQPRIDEISMRLVLRSLVLLGLFWNGQARFVKFGRLDKAMSRQNWLSAQIRLRHPGAKVVDVARGHTAIVDGHRLEVRCPVSFSDLPGGHEARTELTSLARESRDLSISMETAGGLTSSLETLFKAAPAYQLQAAIDEWDLRIDVATLRQEGPKRVSSILGDSDDGSEEPTDLPFERILPMLGATAHLQFRKVTKNRERWHVTMRDDTFDRLVMLNQKTEDAFHIFNLIVATKLKDGIFALLLGDAANAVQPLALLPFYDGPFSTKNIKNQFDDDKAFIEQGHVTGLTYWDSQPFHVIKVSHHGSDENILSGFYETVVSAGVSAFGNSSAEHLNWRHPSAALLSTLHGIDTPKATPLDFRCTNGNSNTHPCSSSSPPCRIGPSGTDAILYSPASAPNHVQVAVVSAGPGERRCPLVS